MVNQVALPPTLSRWLINREAAVAYVCISATKFSEMDVFGNFIGIASSDAANGEDLETCLNGLFTLPKAAVAIPQGNFCSGIAAITTPKKTTSANTLIGKAALAAAFGDATVSVLIG